MLKQVACILIILSGKLSAQSPSCIPSIVISTSQNDICFGTSITIHGSVINGGTNAIFKWKRNHKVVNGITNAEYIADNYHDGEIVTCEYTCHTTCGTDTTIVSNEITIHVLNDVIPAITVFNSDSLICEGQNTVFTTTAYYGNEIPSYEWKVNDISVGAYGPTYATDSLTNGSKVECFLTISSRSCPGTKTASSRINIYVYPMVHPAIKITPSKTYICRGEAVTFEATANGGTYPSFAWEINGKPTGDVGPSLTTSALNDGDSISCTVTIDLDSRCHTNTISAPSNKVVIHVQDYKDPSLVISAPNLNICSGNTLTFSATYQNAGDYKYFQWKVNGDDILNNSPTYSSNQFNDGDKVSCTLSTSIPGCAFLGSAQSNTEIVVVRKSPQITFHPPDITIETGESAKLNASINGNITSYVWTPAGGLVSTQTLTPVTIPLFSDTSFVLSVTDTNGCTEMKKIAIKVLRRLYMPSAFTPNNDGKNDIFRIPQDASIELQDFSIFDRWGNVIFRTSDFRKGWDGTYHNKNLESGTYIYVIKGTVNNKKVVLKGTITLIR